MDWMHNFLVNGIANLEVWAFLRACKAELGLTFAQLDKYVKAAWTWPCAQATHKINEVFTASRERSLILSITLLLLASR